MAEVEVGVADGEEAVEDSDETDLKRPLVVCSSMVAVL